MIKSLKDVLCSWADCKKSVSDDTYSIIVHSINSPEWSMDKKGHDYYCSRECLVNRAIVLCAKYNRSTIEIDDKSPQGDHYMQIKYKGGNRDGRTHREIESTYN